MVDPRYWSPSAALEDGLALGGEGGAALAVVFTVETNVDRGLGRRIQARLEGGAELFPEGFVSYQDERGEKTVDADRPPRDEK